MSSRRRLYRPPVDRTLLVMIAVTLTLLVLGFLAVTHAHDGNNPGQVCRPIPGTSRLDCG